MMKSIIILMIMFGIFAGQSKERKARELEAKKVQEQAQKIAKIKEENIKYFNENSSKILSDVRNAIKSKEYQKIIERLEKVENRGRYKRKKK